MIQISTPLAEALISALKDSKTVADHLSAIQGQSENLSFELAFDRIDDMMHDNFIDHENILGEVESWQVEEPERIPHMLKEIKALHKRLESRHEQILAALEKIKDQAEKVEELISKDIDTEATLTADQAIDLIEWAQIGVIKL